MAPFRAARADRRRATPPRVVRRVAPAPVFSARVASGYLTGWRAAATLRDLFPVWFATHVSHLSFTPGNLLGVAHALVMLVNTTYCELEEHEWLEWGPPEAVLHGGHTMPPDEALGILEEVSGYLERPQPILHGIGAMFALDVDVFDRDFGPLTLALWRMAEATEWGIGIQDWKTVLHWLPQATQRVMLRLPALPPLTDMAALCRAVGWSDPAVPVAVGPLPRGLLLAYACARTGNPTADTSNGEVDHYYGAQWAEGWEDIPEMAVRIAAARQIAGAYSDWERQIQQHPRRELPALATWLQALAAEHQPAPWLIEQVALDDDDDRTIPIGDL
ncbi:MAG: hypothetical protein HC828_06825 [Blastochloris sp.]|nr:hypothetical protein [Blastochloris sp.]